MAPGVIPPEILDDIEHHTPDSSADDFEWTAQLIDNINQYFPPEEHADKELQSLKAKTKVTTEH